MVIAAPAILMVAPSGINGRRGIAIQIQLFTAPYSPECSPQSGRKKQMPRLFAQAQQHQRERVTTRVPPHQQKRVNHHAPTSNIQPTSTTSSCAKPHTRKKPVGRRRAVETTAWKIPIRAPRSQRHHDKGDGIRHIVDQVLVVRCTRDAVRNRGQLPTPGSRCSYLSAARRWGWKPCSSPARATPPQRRRWRNITRRYWYKCRVEEGES